MYSMKILMVCLGNICRSPMAQGILENKIKEEELDVEVDSAATSDYHIGDPPDPRAIKKAAEYKIDITHYRGRQIAAEDFEKFDKIYVMDSSNYSNTLEVCSKDNAKNKVEMILNLSYPGKNKSVPDPYFGGEDGFEEVYRMLDAACDVIIQDIKNDKG